MTHPSFDTFFAHGVKDASNDTYVMDAAGWLRRPSRTALPTRSATPPASP
jgi:hypothetical protein